MTSLADAYERDANGASQRRVYAGTALFAAGAILVVGGILSGATHLVMGPNPTDAAKYGARELAITLVGLGIPATFVGVFTVLPANRFQRAAAGGGSLLAVVGVVLLRAAYPYDWFATAATVPSTTVLAGGVVYALGLLTTFWCLFTAVATFKTRNSPGGTVSMTFTENGKTKTVEVPREDLDDARAALSGGGSFGGVGVFGTDTDVEDTSPQPTSDGGQTTRDIREVGDDAGPNADVGPGGDSGPDEYCGSCEHFDYIRTDDGDIQPYCGFHDGLMEDMDACEQWTRNDA
ncbi:DUF7139 domain-containing protein [Halarchaeum sp. P4]|uniref:DUF7139 domain-containing protein n=1 Tax=Halarchaeum sp. P4 TaxID=3421639 RepID=UPI003EC0FA1B